MTGTRQVQWPTSGAGSSGWTELAPLLRRVVRAEPDALVRVRAVPDRVSAFAVIPSGALVGRTVAASAPQDRLDVTVSAAELVIWLDDPSAPEPAPMDEKWLSPLPPVTGWQRIDTVPEAVVRDVIRQGAAAHIDAANLDLGARAAQNLLDTPVLTVTNDGFSTALTNRSLSALTAMGFLPVGDSVIISVAGRWTRVAARNGSVFTENRTGGLGLSSRTLVVPPQP